MSRAFVFVAVLGLLMIGDRVITGLMLCEAAQACPERAR